MRTEVEDADKEIIDGLLGNPKQQLKAIECAYARYAKPLTGFIRESVAPTLDEHEVATAVNNTFIALAKYAERGRFRAQGALLSTLLFGIARLKAYDELRQKGSLSRTSEDEEIATVACDLGMDDEEFAGEVAKRLAASPEISELWKAAVELEAAREIIRIFRLWVSDLPRLQKKVAQALLLHFGSATNEEIAEELAKTGPRPPVASVKSARKQITAKFKEFLRTKFKTSIETTERNTAS